jgi:uncharacterized protein YxeA
MNPQPYSRKKILIFAGIFVVCIAVIIALAIIFQGKPQNQFGNLIRIHNYDQKVKNVSSDMRDATESYLYNIVKENKESSFDASTVDDARIRDNSESQDFSKSENVYSGEFIVDMESIRQSYRVQYSYSSDENNIHVGGNPVVISCLDEDQLKYGAFDCKDFVSGQAASYDSILQHLPFQNFSYRITPDSTQGDVLVLKVQLTIPDSDLKGDTASRLAVIDTYKQEVLDWIRSKGANPDDYTITYNYDEAGNVIPEEIIYEVPEEL